MSVPMSGAIKTILSKVTAETANVGSCEVRQSTQHERSHFSGLRIAEVQLLSLFNVVVV